MGRNDNFDDNMMAMPPVRRMPRIGFVIPNPTNMPTPVARPSRDMRMPPIVQPIMGQQRQVVVETEDFEDDF